MNYVKCILVILGAYLFVFLLDSVLRLLTNDAKENGIIRKITKAIHVVDSFLKGCCIINLGVGIELMDMYQDGTPDDIKKYFFFMLLLNNVIMLVVGCIYNFYVIRGDKSTKMRVLRKEVE